MKPRVGQTLSSTVDDTTVIVVRAPLTDVTITCGGAEMADPKSGAAPGTADSAQMDGTQLGKRYADDELGIELLCTKPGKGSLAVDGNPLPVKGAKALPASD
ncbi:hypothetical protein [Streptomyces sp. NPDC088746]|uniref:Uncharacterized protein n=1 Tax=Streptomyces sp. NBC_00148 TaxID=2903626 RepID=A0AAU1M2R5_9ACTN